LIKAAVRQERTAAKIMAPEYLEFNKNGPLIDGYATGTYSSKKYDIRVLGLLQEWILA